MGLGLGLLRLGRMGIRRFGFVGLYICMNSLSSGEVELNDIYLFVIYCGILWCSSAGRGFGEGGFGGREREPG